MEEYIFIPLPSPVPLVWNKVIFKIKLAWTKIKTKIDQEASNCIIQTNIFNQHGHKCRSE